MTEKKDWIARSIEETPEQRAERKAARDRRYAHLMNKPRDWIADMRKNRPGAGCGGLSAVLRQCPRFTDGVPQHHHAGRLHFGGV